MKVKFEFNEVQRAFQRGSGDFAIPLNGMTIAYGKESALNRDREIQATPFYQLLTVKVASAESWDEGRMTAWFGGRHSHNSDNGPQSDRVTELVGGDTLVRIQIPPEYVLRTIRQPQPFVPWARKSTC